MFELNVDKMTRPSALANTLSSAGPTLNSEPVGVGLCEFVESLKRHKTPFSP